MIMSLPWRRQVLLLLLCVSHTLAENPFDCSSVELSGVKYDLTLLHDDRLIARERQSPPTLMRDELRFNICKDLGQRSDVKSNDQVRGTATLSVAYSYLRPFSVGRAHELASLQRTRKRESRCVSLISICQNRLNIDRLDKA